MASTKSFFSARQIILWKEFQPWIFSPSCQVGLTRGVGGNDGIGERHSFPPVAHNCICIWRTLVFVFGHIYICFWQNNCICIWRTFVFVFGVHSYLFLAHNCICIWRTFVFVFLPHSYLPYFPKAGTYDYCAPEWFLLDCWVVCNQESESRNCFSSATIEFQWL